jgi:hypothetical protein
MNDPVSKSKDISESSALTIVALSEEPASSDADTKLTVCDDPSCSLNTSLILTAAPTSWECTSGPCKLLDVSYSAIGRVECLLEFIMYREIAPEEFEGVDLDP